MCLYPATGINNNKYITMVTLDTGNITNILDEINNDVNLEAHDDGE